MRNLPLWADSEVVAYASFAAMLDVLLNHPTQDPYIKFALGKFGRMDMFYLREIHWSGNRAQCIYYGYFDGGTPAASLAALALLDQTVATHPELTCSAGGRGSVDCVWGRVSNKNDHPDLYHDTCAAALYARRIEEQQLILGGKLKRGHKAFGFTPMDGHS